MSVQVDMRLPSGFKCADCFASRRFCEPLGITKPENTMCAYYPVRFQASLECLERLERAAANNGTDVSSSLRNKSAEVQS